MTATSLVAAMPARFLSRAFQSVTLNRGGRTVSFTGLPAVVVIIGAVGLVVVCVVRFVRLRRHARATRDALEQSEARYRLLFDSNPCPMWVYDYATTRILDVNDAATAQYGYSRDEFTHMTLGDLRAREELERLDAMLKDVPLTGERVHYATHRTKDGRSIEAEVRGHPLNLPGQRLRLVVSTDITERLVAERVARDAESRAHATSNMLQALIDAAPQAMVVVDLAWRVTHWNRAAEGLFGWTAGEVMGREVPFVPDDQREEVARRQASADAGHINKPVETVRLRKDGKTVSVLLATAPLLGPGAKPAAFIASYTDLTERKSLEDQLRQSQKMEAIGTLAGGVAHDFNNILTVISSYSSMLLDENRYPEIHTDLEEISTAARRATGLTRQLLTFSRKAIVQFYPVNLNAVVTDMQPMLRRLLMTHIEFITTLDPDLGEVTADPSQLEQILMNLVVNAADAMPDGGTLVIETRSIELDEAYTPMHAGVRPGDYVLLAVTDTGVGMDAATIQKVFEPFFTTKEVGRGTGLGLATVYAIVKQLGGHIWVYSEPGHGAAFKIYLPREGSGSSAAESSTLDGPPIRTGTVLLVEDDDAVRRATRRMLEKSGFSVLEAPDGEAGLAVASNFGDEIDVVVTDLMMPRMKGGEFARVLAESHPHLRVVFTSGYTDEAVLRRGLVSAAHTFLQKPFTGAQLAHAISSLLEQGDAT